MTWGLGTIFLLLCSLFTDYFFWSMGCRR